jgi:hypothetical protein
MKTKTGKKIRANMIFQEKSGAAIARKFKVSTSAVNLTVAGKKRIPRIRQALSKELCLPSDIWAEMDRELDEKKGHVS